jgi:hypothetical protein
VKIFYPTGTRTAAPPGRPARSQSLYRLSYPGSVVRCKSIDPSEDNGTEMCRNSKIRCDFNDILRHLDVIVTTFYIKSYVALETEIRVSGRVIQRNRMLKCLLIINWSSSYCFVFVLKGSTYKSSVCFGGKEVNSFLLQPLNILFWVGIVMHFVYCKMVARIIHNYYTTILTVIDQFTYETISNCICGHFMLVISNRFRPRTTRYWVWSLHLPILRGKRYDGFFSLQKAWAHIASEIIPSIFNVWLWFI